MTMRLRIHHGAVQIGGNCIELGSNGTRLLLDLGMPLEGGDPILPDVAGLADGDDPTLAGIVLSHPHLDHYGLAAAAHPSIPVWLGEGAIRLLSAAAPFSRGAVLPEGTNGYRDRTPFEIGPFRLAPYLMDHSAFDAYGLMIEADDKRILYTGDFRGHGRKSECFTRFLDDPPADIDILLMEGTTYPNGTLAIPAQDAPAQSGSGQNCSAGTPLATSLSEAAKDSHARVLGSSHS